MKKVILAALTALLLVPIASAAPKAPAAKAVNCAQVLKAKVNLNKATPPELQCLKGVKADVAKDIIANRPFKDSNDFERKIEDIGNKLYDLNKANVTF